MNASNANEIPSTKSHNVAPTLPNHRRPRFLSVMLRPNIPPSIPSALPKPFHLVSFFTFLACLPSHLVSRPSFGLIPARLFRFARQVQTLCVALSFFPCPVLPCPGRPK